MANLVVLDGLSAPRFIAATGTGTNVDPFILIRSIDEINAKSINEVGRTS